MEYIIQCIEMFHNIQNSGEKNWFSKHTMILLTETFEFEQLMLQKQQYYQYEALLDRVLKLLSMSMQPPVCEGFRYACFLQEVGGHTRQRYNVKL